MIDNRKYVYDVVVSNFVSYSNSKMMMVVVKINEVILQKFKILSIKF